MSGTERTARLRAEASRVFDASLRDAGTTNRAVAEASCVAETRVRRWRSDDSADLDAPPPTTALLACSQELFDAWVARAREARTVLHGAPPAASTRELLLRVLHADGALQQEIAAALERGVQPGAVPGLLSRSSASEQARDALLRALRGGLAR
jgi:hypothetical protein